MRLTHIIAAVIVTTATTTALAQTRSQVYGSDLEQQAMTVYMAGEIGMNTFESEAAGSKESQESTRYTLGGWAGEERVVGASITSTEDVVPFALNDSEVHTKFRDIRIMPRFWIFTPSIGASFSEVDVESDGEKTVSLYGSGINAGIGAHLSLHRAIVVSADVMTVQTNDSFDKLDQGTELGDRNEANIGASVDLTERMVDLLVGYRVREYTIKNGEEESKEKSQGAYAGLRLGLYF